MRKDLTFALKNRWNFGRSGGWEGGNTCGKSMFKWKFIFMVPKSCTDVWRPFLTLVVEFVTPETQEMYVFGGNQKLFRQLDEGNSKNNHHFWDNCYVQITIYVSISVSVKWG